MTIVELYESIGGNYNDVLGRLMKDSLIEKFVMMYLTDTSYDTLMKALDSGNLNDGFRAAHSLKGVSANLGFEEMKQAAHELTEQLRPQTEPAEPSLIEAVKKSQQKIIAGIKKYKESM